MIATSAFVAAGNERAYVLDCLESGWLSQGKYVQQLEESYAEKAGRKHSVACSSGTAALHLAMLALGIGQADTVIVPALTYVATANAARYCGASIAFADINADDWCISAQECNLLANRTAGRVFVVPVHLYDALAALTWIADENALVVDAAHAPMHVQNSIFSTVSFYASKIIACGEGGMVLTDDDGLAAVIRLFRGQGAGARGSYHHSVVGYNYRMTDLQAAVALAQLEKYDESVAKRRELANRYRENLSGAQVMLQGGARAEAWSFGVLVPPTSNRDKVRSDLCARSIETRPFFEPLPSLPPYKCEAPPVATVVAQRGICLPLHTSLSLSDVDCVCETLMEVIAS